MALLPPTGGSPLTQTTVTSTTPTPPPPPTAPTTTFGPTPFSQTEAGITFAAQQQQNILGIQQASSEQIIAAQNIFASQQQAQLIAAQSASAQALAQQQQANALALQQAEQTFQKEQLEKRFAEEAKVRARERERIRQANITQLRVERQGTFAALMKSGDQVRAVMFALGIGPDNDVFDVRAKALGTTVQELKGATTLRATTENALSRVLGRQVTVGAEGARGLGTAISSARAFVQGGADVQALLTSAFGVGSLREGEQPGLSATRLQELVRQVTPGGIL